MILFDQSILSIIGIAAGILILSGWVHQIIKGYKTKSLQDVSKYLMVMFGAGSVLWVIYGMGVSDIFITGTNVTAVFLMIVVFIMKKNYARKIKT